MPGHDIITIGASAGGVEALTAVARGFPGDLPAAVFVALHVPAHGTSLLPQILSRRGALPAKHADDGEVFQSGRIYVAPPDHHLLIQGDVIRLSRGPRENGSRPAIDPLFRSAARWHGPRVIGVILSGTLDDGTAGLAAIKERGGIAVIQDPDDALFPGMPRHALESVGADHVLAAPRLPELLSRLARQGLGEAEDPPLPLAMGLEAEIAEFDLEAIQAAERPGPPSPDACPESAGVLWEIQDGDLARFRGRVGHDWSPTSLLSAQSKGLEVTPWTAFQALEERAAMTTRMARRDRIKGRAGTASRFEAQSREAKERAATIHQVLTVEDPAAKVAPTNDQEGGP